MFSELIIRHGPDAWLDPLLNELGPWLQLQLGDVADFLEAASSYYDWRNVSSTTATSVVYAALLAVSAIPDLEYSIKVFWLACGLYFFVSRPVATLYPRFRHVMDPMRWMYWDSPTTSKSDDVIILPLTNFPRHPTNTSLSGIRLRVPTKASRLLSTPTQPNHLRRRHLRRRLGQRMVLRLPLHPPHHPGLHRLAIPILLPQRPHHLLPRALERPARPPVHLPLHPQLRPLHLFPSLIHPQIPHSLGTTLLLPPRSPQNHPPRQPPPLLQTPPRRALHPLGSTRRLPRRPRPVEHGGAAERQRAL